MFEQPRFISNSLNVVFPRLPRIRRMANDFEDRLAGLYGQPQSIPLPDELDPQVPRIIFQSASGHSQILISQVSIALNVSYDGEWTTNPDLRSTYLEERASLIYDLCSAAEATPLFSGLTTHVRLPSRCSDQEILDRLSTILGIADSPPELSELSLRLSSVLNGRFFNNTTIQSYREWLPAPQVVVPRLPALEASSRGVELVQDFNDRYAFNELPDYHTSLSAGVEILQVSQATLAGWIDRVAEDSRS